MAKDTRTRMIETTSRLLLLRGYYGTALSDILAESGAPRGSLYFHFPGGKDELVLAATRASADATTEALVETLAGARGPAEAVRAYAEEAARLMQESDFTFGCPIAPVVLDGDAGVAALSDLCRATFAEWTRLIEEACAAAGIETRRAHAIAVMVVASLEGALMMARAYRDVAPLLTAAAEFETMVRAALPRRRQRT